MRIATLLLLILSIKVAGTMASLNHCRRPRIACSTELPGHIQIGIESRFEVRKYLVRRSIFPIQHFPNRKAVVQRSLGNNSVEIAPNFGSSSCGIGDLEGGLERTKTGGKVYQCVRVELEIPRQPRIRTGDGTRELTSNLQIHAVRTLTNMLFHILLGRGRESPCNWLRARPIVFVGRNAPANAQERHTK